MKESILGWLDHSDLVRYLPSVIIPAVLATLKMLISTAVLSMLLGIILGIILVVTAKDGLSPNRGLHYLLGKIIDVLRSFPTMILIVALGPLTRLVIGTRIGVGAAIFTLTVGCTPFAARMAENALLSVDFQLIRAARVFGASNGQIVLKIMLVEALPNLIANYTMMMINMLNMTAVAGAVGAGGLGAVALTYGYQRFDDAIMYFVVGLLLLFVLFIQGVGKAIYNKVK